MFVRSTSPRPIAQRLCSFIVAGLLALSLMLGVAGTATTVSAQPPQPSPTQPSVYCIWYSRAETIKFLHFDPGPGGHWECDVSDSAPNR